MTGFIIGYRVRDGYQWSELQHTGDKLLGMPWDLEDIEMGTRVRSGLFMENVFGIPDWTLTGVEGE